MKIYVQEAARIGFEAKYEALPHRDSPLRHEALLQEGSELVETLASDRQVPEELRLAATGVWQAVMTTNSAHLITSLSNRPRFNNPVRRSESGWQVSFISQGETEAQISGLVGMVFRRDRGPQTPLDRLEEAAYLGQPVAAGTTEAYIWVDPEHRRQGAASQAARILSLRLQTEAVNPFPVGPENVAAIQFVQHVQTAQPTVPLY